MVSQFGSLGYTIMGKTADLKVVQKTILIPFTRRVSRKHSLPKKLAVHRVLYPSMLTENWVEGKSVEEKDAQPTERTAALWGLSNKIDSRIWMNFTRKGLRMESSHQEPPHTDVSMNLATVVIRGVLPGLRKRRTGLLPRGSKSDESKFYISFGNQGPRVWRKGGEAHSPRCLKSSVKFPQFVMIWGAISSAGVGPLCFLKTNVTAPIYQYILEHFMLPSADQLFKDADFIFQQDLAPAHTSKCTESQLNDHGVWCA